MADLPSIAADIKNSLSAVIWDLKVEMQGVAYCLSEVQQVTNHHDTNMQDPQNLAV